MTEQTAWKVMHNHIAMELEDDRGLGAVLFHRKESAIAATEKHIRQRAAEGNPDVGYKPPWGVHFCDFVWERENGKPSWEWRLHRCDIERTKDGVTVTASYDCRTLVSRDVRTYTEVDGERIAVGWHRQPVVIEDWAPFCRYDRDSDNPNDPDDPDGRMLRTWTVEPVKVTLEWGDTP